MNPLNNQTREVLSMAAVFVAVVIGVWGERRRLRPWYFAVAGVVALVTIPIVLTLLRMARAGEFTGWGGLVLIVYLLPAALLAATSVTGLLTMTVLLPFYGFDTRTREQRRAERRFRRSAVGRRLEGRRKLNLTLMLLAIVVLVFKFGYLRPHSHGGAMARPPAASPATAAH